MVMAPKLRYDLLASVRYQNRVLKAVRPNTVVAILDSYFMRSKKAHNIWYLNLLESDKNLELVIHLLWGGSRHQFTIKDRHRAFRRTKRLYNVLCDYHDRVSISPFLEHGKKEKFMVKTFDMLQNTAPDFTYINSFSKHFGGVPVNHPGILQEVHHTDHSMRRPDIISTDGVDVTRAMLKEYQQKYPNCKHIGAWRHDFNGKTSLDDKTPPMQRRNFPSRNDIIQIGDWYYD